MSYTEELPKKAPDRFRFEADQIELFGWHWYLEEILEGVPPIKVETALDLYTGTGIFAAGMLYLYRACTVHAVDFHANVLSDCLQNDPRVIFHQGLVSEMLLSGQLPPADLVGISYANRLHGLNEVSIEALKHLTRGYLVTQGDNYGLEREPYFQRAFKLEHYCRNRLACVWSALE
jgi:predicted rRNA methylase YqxC with S4 and FtsJ domains